VELQVMELQTLQIVQVVMIGQRKEFILKI